MPCPSAEALAALYDCVLPREQAARLRDHVARCPRCASDLRTLGELLDCPEPDQPLTAEQLARIDHSVDLVSDPLQSERRASGDDPNAVRPSAKSPSRLRRNQK